MEQDKVSKLSDVGKNVWDEDGDRSRKMEPEKKVSYRQRWDKARATKKVVFWVAVGANMRLPGRCGKTRNATCCSVRRATPASPRSPTVSR